MVKVNAKPSIRLLTKRFMKINRGRNVIAVLAIVMTTVMFTSMFTAAASVIKSNQQQDMRESMDASHISIQDMTKEQFDAVKKDENIEKYGCTIFMSSAENEELKTAMTEIRYADSNGAEGYLCSPTEGRLPEKINEVAMSTITLDLLGIDAKVGSPVTLQYTMSGEPIEEELVLCGFWKGDPISMAQEVWVSKELCLKQCKEATPDAINQGDYEGDYNISIWCGSIFRLEKIMDDFDKKYGISQWQNGKISINPAFDLFAEDAFPFGTCIVILLIIFASGYLIIFNVFRISVQNDIRAYGLLKNIGTTGNQLKQIVQAQALSLSVIGVPIGLCAGYLIGKGMTPYLVADMGTTEFQSTQAVIAANPWIFLTAAVFSMVTVFVACQRPCRIVSKISPVEAVRMTENDHSGTHRHTGAVTPAALAFQNMRRTWKKAAVVIVSLALPIVVLNSVYTIVNGFDFELFLDNYMSSDINATGCTNNGWSSNYKAVSPQLQKDILLRDDVESMAVVYETEGPLDLSQSAEKNMADMISLAEEGGQIRRSQLDREKELLKSGIIPMHILGINEDAFDKIELQEEINVTWKEFASGNYVIASKQSNGLGSYYEDGERIAFSINDGEPNQYQVLAQGEMPYDLSYPFSVGTYFDITVLIPEELYLARGGNENAMTVGIDTAKGQRDEVEQWLKEKIQQSERTVYVNSRAQIEQSCSNFINKYYVVLGLLFMVLLFIGVLNFFNTSTVSIMNRRKELSLLEAVGMTKGQVKKMLLTEGMVYLAIALVLADTVGVVISSMAIERTVGAIFFFTLHQSVVPSMAILPVLILIGVFVPLYNYNRMCRETIVERLRTE